MIRASRSVDKRALKLNRHRKTADTVITGTVSQSHVACSVLYNTYRVVASSLVDIIVCIGEWRLV